MWKRAVRGKLYRPLKQGGEPAAGCRWDRAAEEGWRGYQTRANQMLRERMLAEFAVAVRSAVRA